MPRGAIFAENVESVRLYFAETQGASYNVKAGLDRDIQTLYDEVLEKPIHIDFVFQAQILENRSVVKDDPEDPVGDYTVDGEIFLGGIFFKHVF